MNGKTLLVALLRRWHLIAVAALIGGGVAYLAGQFIRPVYRSEVVLASVQREGGMSGLGSLVGQFGGLAELAGVQLPQVGDANIAIETLKSRDLTIGLIGSESLMPVLFADRWIAESGQWRSDAPTINDALRLFDQRIRSVRQDAKTGIIRLAIEWHDPDVAAAWANALVNRANKTMRQREIAEADLAIAALSSEVEKASAVEVRSALYRLIEAQLKSKALAAGREQFAFRIVDPAIAADLDKPIWPNRLAIIFLGLLGGALLVVLVLALVELRRVALVKESDRR